MDIVVTEADGLPDKAYVSIRIGETRRQGPYKPNETFHFPVTQHATMKMDLFQFLGRMLQHHGSLSVRRAGAGPDHEDLGLFQFLGYRGLQRPTVQTRGRGALPRRPTVQFSRPTVRTLPGNSHVPLYKLKNDISLPRPTVQTRRTTRSIWRLFPSQRDVSSRITARCQFSDETLPGNSHVPLYKLKNDEEHLEAVSIGDYKITARCQFSDERERKRPSRHETAMKATKVGSARGRLRPR